jgi:hypothetical protein
MLKMVKKVLKLRGKAENIRSEMEKLVSTLGVAAKKKMNIICG